MLGIIFNVPLVPCEVSSEASNKVLGGSQCEGVVRQFLGETASLQLEQGRTLANQASPGWGWDWRIGEQREFLGATS